MIQKVIDAYDLEREMYRKCIDTDEEIEKGRAKWDSGLWIRYKVFEDTITLAPRIDAVPVVRCKDCKHFFKDDRRYVIVYRCELLHEDMRDYFFCADGERREDEK